jgi:hypothetical protein
MSSSDISRRAAAREHTTSILATLGVGAAELAALEAEHVI